MASNTTNSNNMNNLQAWDSNAIFENEHYDIFAQNNTGGVSTTEQNVSIVVMDKLCYKTFNCVVSDSAPVPIERFAELFYTCLSKSDPNYLINIERIHENNEITGIKIVLEIQSTFIPYRKELICTQPENLESINVLGTIITLSKKHDCLINMCKKRIKELENNVSSLESRISSLENTVNQQNNTINNFINNINNNIKNGLYSNQNNVNMVNTPPVDNNSNTDGPRVNTFPDNNPNLNVRANEIGVGLGLGLGLSFGIPVLPMIPISPLMVGLNTLNISGTTNVNNNSSTSNINQNRC